MNIALARSELECLQRATCLMITGIRRTTIKVLEMLLDPPTCVMVVESATLMAAYRLLRPDLTNLGIEHNRIQQKEIKWTVSSVWQRTHF